MKHILMLLMAAALVISAVSAGGEDEESADGRTIRMSSWLATEGASRDTLLEMISRFQDENPGVEVELINIPYAQTQQQILVTATAGRSPDVMQLVPMFAAPIAAMGALKDLSEDFSSAEINDIPAAAYQAGIYDGRLVTVPWQIAPIVVLADRELLRRAGLPEAIPESWDGFKDAVARISALGDDIYGFGARTAAAGNTAFWFFPAMWGHGGRFLDDSGNIVFNSPETVEALNWYQEIALSGQTPMGMAIPESRVLFAQGKVGFVFEGPWMRGIMRSMTESGRDADGSYVVGPFPRAADGNRYTIANNHVLGVGGQSKQADTAVALIRFFTQNADIAKFYYENMAAIPVYKSILADPVFNDEFVKTFVDAADYADALPSENPSFAQALEFMSAGLQAAMLGEDTAEIAEEIETSIKTLYKQ